MIAFALSLVATVSALLASFLAIRREQTHSFKLMLAALLLATFTEICTYKVGVTLGWGGPGNPFAKAWLLIHAPGLGVVESLGLALTTRIWVFLTLYSVLTAPLWYCGLLKIRSTRKARAQANSEKPS